MVKRRRMDRMATLNYPATYLELPSYVEDPQTW